MAFSMRIAKRPRRDSWCHVCPRVDKNTQIGTSGSQFWKCFRGMAIHENRARSNAIASFWGLGGFKMSTFFDGTGPSRKKVYMGGVSKKSSRSERLKKARDERQAREKYRIETQAALCFSIQTQSHRQVCLLLSLHVQTHRQVCLFLCWHTHTQRQMHIKSRRYKKTRKHARCILHTYNDKHFSDFFD